MAGLARNGDGLGRHQGRVERHGPAFLVLLLQVNGQGLAELGVPLTPTPLPRGARGPFILPRPSGERGRGEGGRLDAELAGKSADELAVAVLIDEVTLGG